MALVESDEFQSDEAVADVSTFSQSLRYDDLPADVQLRARRSLLDLIGVAAGGSALRSSVIIGDFADAHFGAGARGARILFDGRRVSVPGAAMAGAASIEALAGHDGHKRAKGHAGVAILPALLAVADEMAPCPGDEFITCLVIGYEIALRAGIALHAECRDFHSSGAWNALGAAAAAGRAIRLDGEQFAHALGAAEFFAPRSPMMRMVDYPTMVKEAAPFGAFAGVSAALMASAGFTGAPAATVEDELAGRWTTLGSTWMIRDMYLKNWPVSRWAHPAIQAALDIRDEILARPVARLVVETFEEAARLSVAEPVTTEAAQYSVPFPLAAAVVHGTIDHATVTTGLADPEVLALSRKVDLAVSPTLSSAFPERRQARLIVIFEDGEILRTNVRDAEGEPETPLSDTALIDKFIANCEPSIGRRRAYQIAEQVAGLEKAKSVGPLLDLITAARS